MKLPRISSLFFASALSLASVPVFAEIDFGNIAFVGDSITQGGGTADELSYRYSLWKCFVDNNVDYNPVGSTTIFRYTGSDLTNAKDYLGVSFNNRNEGHYGWRTHWVVNGKTSGHQANTGSGSLSDWLKNAEYYPKGYADTMTLMLAVNDIADGSSLESIAGYAKQIVQTYQNANGNVKSHVFSILTTNQGAERATKIKNYNALIKSEIEAGTWGENVVYSDVSRGFDASIHTKSDNVHPNAQGALIVAGNIARALGVGQRTVGQERRAANRLAVQTSFAANDSSGVSVSVNTQGAQSATMGYSNTTGRWSVDDAGNILIKSDGNTASDLRYQYSTEAGTHEFTLEVGFRMNDTDSAQTNRLGIWCGNGETVGLIYVEENALFWDSTVLYRNTDLSDLFVDDFSSLRLAWINEDSANGIASGYYVWLDGMLIGEALSGSTLADIAGYKNSIVIGNTASSYDTFAEISDISFDAGTAWSPNMIPEPSAFGLLAGLGALALVASRRRRSRR
ncbi:MAG: hypothetical protein IJX22_02125 [Opitutales bacterium]|nr:hypothetical protein [Opitutales bacterium]